MASTPNRPPHPGLILWEHHMRPREMNQSTLADLIHMSPSEVHRLIHGHRRISAPLATKLAAVFGTTARYWLDRQSDYDLAGAEAEAGQAQPTSAQAPARASGSEPRTPASPQPDHGAAGEPQADGRAPSDGLRSIIPSNKRRRGRSRNPGDAE